MSMRVIVGKNGSLRYIYSEVMNEVMAGLGKSRAARASHVEPWGGLSEKAKVHIEIAMSQVSDKCDRDATWWADMLPVMGPVMGPYRNRQEALDAEVEWLLQHNIPLPEQLTSPAPVGA